MVRMAVTLGLIAMVTWGVWAVLAKVATRTISPELAVVVSYSVSIALALGYLLFRGGTVTLDGQGVALAALAGVFGGVAVVSFYAGLNAGRTAIVTTVAALYFVVAAILGVVVLGESVAPRDLAGIGFAMVAVFLLAR